MWSRVCAPPPPPPAVQEYVRSDPSGRDEDSTLLVQIKQGFELPTFCGHFFGWNPELWASNKTYEQYLEDLKSSGGGQAESVAEVMGWLVECVGLQLTYSNEFFLSPLQVVAQAGVFKMYPYEDLKDKCPADVDPSNKEVSRSWSHDIS